MSYDGADWGPWQLVWPRLNDGPGECHSLFWDYRKGCLVDMVRMGSNYPHGRTMGRGESPDFGLHWTPPVRVLTEDADDPEDTQVYNVEAGIYAGIYLAVVHLYRTESGLCFPQLASSRDGYRFSRTFREPFLPLGPEGGPEGGMIWCGFPVFDGERLRLTYSAVRETHNMKIVSPGWREPPTCARTASCRSTRATTWGRWSPGRSAARRGTPFRWTARCRCS